MSRRYVQRRRAESQARTRRRIVDATIELHETVGPVGATITAIARRAGVSRLTVYRNFPDEVSLLRACTRTYNEEHPAPDPAGLAAIADPKRRLEAALAGVYGYYADNERMLASGADAMPTHPALATALEPVLERQRELVVLLSAGWPVDGEPGSLLRGAIAHAVAFPTWRSLRAGAGLTNSQVVTLMVGMVQAAADGSAKRAPQPHGRSDSRNTS